MDEATSAVLSPGLPTTQGTLLDRKLKKSPGLIGSLIFGGVLVAGIGYTGFHLANDISGVHIVTIWPYVLLGVALLIALGFEFVNGFHDTANAVATVIYTHSLEPHVAVVWSGMWNLIGVLTSSGGVAFSILSLLPVELILQVGRGAGFAMVFALLIAAILWNLGTWALGLPASSSHTLIGSIIGVGIANQLMNGRNGTSGVDWAQVSNVFRVLLISPLVGFVGAALLLLVLKFVIKDKALYESPKGDAPPPFWIRALLILTCTGVSFGHGSNDGQKGMGLIMLILIGVVPTAYALNHAVGFNQVQDFAAVSDQAASVLGHYVSPDAVMGDARTDLTEYIRTKEYTANTPLAARQLAIDISHEVELYKTLARVPANQQQNVRNDMYVESEALRLMAKSGQPNFTAQESAIINNYKKHLDTSTKFIPSWVKVAVALALGLGTMVGWKRIVVTVGEKIGKEHLTYAQGASAEIIAAATIIAADQFKMPVSTTHVLSSGVAGTMMANGSGLQLSTIRNIALAWVFTLPAAALLAGCLFWALRQFIQ
ncbi:inorganic phosphate transporter [Pseudacidobacterium ailaaui]|jgi:PiT family inorganic phosphate transporter|uniref:inorganic phosphate transporter n=1 Tax=Pseudacidobacterium ailaaui TaxID=1382359 RepID=UPI00047AAA19|nr:inorganic phosphate transporter [Pseudacidobacterium ailaaui]MBX6359033.1 anion permease [Pseudacidobacterium ailaaui]